MATQTEPAIIFPVTVLIDSAEQHAWTFQGLRSDADRDNRPLTIHTRWQCLGRFPQSNGDYSLDGYVGRVGIERKSMDDAHGTILGWDGRRERFEQELRNLAAMEAAAVIVECSFSDLLNNAPDRGKKTKSQNAKSLHRSVLAFTQDYRVPWLFCDGRRMAEVTAFRFLERFFRKQMEAQKAIERELKKTMKEAAEATNAGATTDKAAEQLLMTM